MQKIILIKTIFINFSVKILANKLKQHTTMRREYKADCFSSSNSAMDTLVLIVDRNIHYI